MPDLAHICRVKSGIMVKEYKQFKFVGMLEAISFLLLLFVAMPLKYLAGIPEAVKYPGWAHGLLFVLYIFFLIQAAVALKWNFKQLVFGFGASLVPFGPFLFDKWIEKKMEKPQ
tara:strand:- start:592 stop:933 length:342 start_codon:yes stop_codon:yes gene_type:complete